MADTKETRRAREKKRYAVGLCIRCGKNELEEGKRYCQFCLEDAGQKTKEMRLRWEAAGLCNVCGKNPKPKKRKICAACRSRKLWKRRKLRNEGKCSCCWSNDPAPNRKLCQRCLDTSARHRQRIRDEVFEAYGGYTCVCCGEIEPLFLTLDHIHGGGNKERLQKGGGGMQTLQRLRRENFPEGFQVLCRNCNWGRHVNGGVCPHQNK